MKTLIKLMQEVQEDITSELERMDEGYLINLESKKRLNLDAKAKENTRKDFELVRRQLGFAIRNFKLRTRKFSR